MKKKLHGTHGTSRVRRAATRFPTSQGRPQDHEGSQVLPQPREKVAEDRGCFPDLAEVAVRSRRIVAVSATSQGCGEATANLTNPCCANRRAKFTISLVLTDTAWNCMPQVVESSIYSFSISSMMSFNQLIHVRNITTDTYKP